MLYIRVDTNNIIGTGHMMRCLTIAEEVKRQGEDVTFLVADKYAQQISKTHGFSAICLNSQWRDLEQELEVLKKLIDIRQIKKLLIDSYFVTEKYLSELHKYVSLIYLDDLNMFAYPVDVLINYNIFAVKLGYKSRHRNARISTEFLLGCEYVPLRKEFCDVISDKSFGRNEQIIFCNSFQKKSRNKRILITSGGSDQYNAIGNILNELEQQKWFMQVEYYVILGKFHLYSGELKAKWKDYSNIFIYEDVSNMSTYMKKCDLAITAGGTTVYELCACGIPSVMYVLADNQYNIAQEFDVRDLIPWCGDVRKDMEGCMERIVFWLEKLLWDDVRLKERGKALSGLVDGDGAIRIAEKIKEI